MAGQGSIRLNSDVDTNPEARSPKHKARSAKPDIRPFPFSLFPLHFTIHTPHTITAPTCAV